MQHYNKEAYNIYSALEASGIGTWFLDIETGMLVMDDYAQKLFGYPEKEAHYNDIFISDTEESLAAIYIGLENAFSSGSMLLSYVPLGASSPIIVRGKKRESADTAFFSGTVQLLAVNNSVNDNTLSTIIAESPVAIGLYVGRELVIGIANDVMLGFWGKPRSIIGQRLEYAVPELEGQPFIQILENIFDTGETYTVTEGSAYLAVDGGVPDLYYFDYTYKPLFDEYGKVYAIMNTAVNVSDRVKAKRKREQSDLQFRNVIEQSPMAIGFLYGPDMVIEIANDKILKIWGKDENILGLPLMEALPEIEGQGFIELLYEVYNTGKPHKGEDVLVKLEHNGVLTDVYVDFSYSALRDEEGNIYGVLVLATDVGDRVKALKEIAASEEKFRSVIYSAQAAVAVFKGRDLVADIANSAFLGFVGRTREEFIGKPLLETMPEIREQESARLLQEVYDKGIKTHHFGRQVNIVRNGELTVNFYNVSYSPLYDSTGEVYGVLDIAIDVTDTVKSQQALEKAETSLRGAVELAGLGTWSYNFISGEIDFSGRLREWFGLNGNITPEHIKEAIHPDDRERVIGKVKTALDVKSGGAFEEEFRVVETQTGGERILHFQGKAYYNADGDVYLISGTALDITSHKKIQAALENQVRERTIALQQANRELEEMNLRLLNSNEELAQYAYVASHDLQEPLRKISMFSNLLKERDKSLANDAVVNKIISSSQRMSLLIKDLLEFSRLLNTDIRFTKTNLNAIVKAVVTDFELLIEEKGAHVDVAVLPEIDAIPLQMNQLFYNLIGNALKFVSREKQPRITVGCEKTRPEDLEQYIIKQEKTEYYTLSVSDNGIGIEEKYQKQIFEVFKRLHSRSEYSGSGIGLAICRRIVANHKGAIFTQSEVGQGTTFYIILPASHTTV